MLTTFWRRALSPSGQWMAAAVGLICLASGWSWALLLIAFFLTSTALTRWGASRKEQRTSAIVAKEGPRDAWQVLANGGFFTLCALLALSDPALRGFAQILGAGALATSTADTWATEIGTLFGREPRTITSLQRVPPGTSGGITMAGTIAALAGAAFIALMTVVCRWASGPHTGRMVVSVIIGGFGGALIDSLIGATIQARRRCPRCQTLTERTVHRCGTATTPASGVRWLDNDAVNAVSGIAGAIIAWSMLQTFIPFAYGR